MKTYHLFKRSLYYTISHFFAVIFAVTVWSSPGFCDETNNADKASDLKNKYELFYINDVKYIKPKNFEVSQSFQEMGGLTRYVAAQDSQVLKLIIPPAAPQAAIPFEITKIKFYGEDGSLSAGSFSVESISGSKGPQTENVIISRSTLHKDGQTMIYLSYTIYAPINKASKKLFVRYENTDLFSLDLEKATVE